jgi:pimeloyl-ACP methyl ester carboxylesterase
VGPTDVIIANRGTDPSDKKDILQDVRIVATGAPTDRINRAMETTRAVQMKYSGKPIIFTGHSLGATVAQHLAEKTGSRSVVFNPGASPFSALNKSFRNSKIYSTGIDPIGLFAKGKTLSLPTKINVHSLSNFY